MVGPPEAADVSLPAPRASMRPTGDDGDAPVRFFLIADVRGYTSFTQRHGDEAAGRLAAVFAELTRTTVEAYGGRLLELRGDEALVVFTSPRAAVRAAVALQQGYVDQTLADPAVPLGVGVGIDAGEAVAVEGGFRGAALNMAARLCTQAAAGEVLVSLEVSHLAGRVDGVRFRTRGQVTLKGFTDPVPVVLLVVEDADPARVEEFRRAVAQERGHHRPTRKVVLAAGTVLAVLAAAGAYAVARPTRSEAAPFTGDRVDLVEPTTGRLLGQVRLRDQPTAIAFGAGSLWTTHRGSGTVSRIDPRSRTVVTRIPVGGSLASVAFGGGAVWVTDQGGRTVARISPDVDEVVDRVTVGNSPTGIAAGASGIWVANSGDATVTRIDPRTGKTDPPLDVGGGPARVAVTRDRVWVTSGIDGTVSAIDPRTHLVQPFRVGTGPEGVALTADSVWVANSLDGTVTRLDAATGTTQATIQVGNGPSDVVAANGRVWVSNEFAALARAGTVRGSQVHGTLVQIDPESNQVDLTRSVAGAPGGLTAADGALWQTAAGVSASHRGGTLTVTTGLFPKWVKQSIDPAMAYDPATNRTIFMTSDGLVGLRRAGGVAGTTVVPDLATALPAPVDGGRTYVFQLRRGIRYSTGSPVRASDFRRALQRAYAVPRSPAAQYFTEIAGARTCQRNRTAAESLDARRLGKRLEDIANGQLRPSPCDLSQGIVTDDAAGTVTIHLDRPDPELLLKLATPWAVAVPAGTPDRDSLATPVPGTGPYRIARYVLGKTLELVRNPYFREWSRAAQPDGYPDRIVLGGGSDPGLDRVLEGTADLAEATFSDRMAELRTQHPAQLHTNPGPYLHFLALGTRAPPFDDLLARQAVNLAVDRAALAALVGEAQPTCQVVPAAFPGYAPHCPYDHDLAEARRLVVRSGTLHQKIVFMFPTDDKTPPESRLVAKALREIGYRVVMRPRPWHSYYTDVAHRGDRLQLADGTGWGADFSSAATYFGPILSCRYARSFGAYGFNMGHYCDRGLDRLVRRAEELQQSQPAAAGRAWAAADRRAVDRAALVPLSVSGAVAVTSKRVGNFQYQPIWGALLDQLWVRS